MLILARKLRESIMIGDNIEITVSAIEGDRVKLAISAPKHVEIHRKEVYMEIQQENRDASLQKDVEFLKGYTRIENR